MTLIGSSLQFHYPLRDSWRKLGHMPQQKALECYIQELCEIDPEWEEKYAVTDDLVSLKFMILARKRNGITYSARLYSSSNTTHTSIIDASVFRKRGAIETPPSRHARVTNRNVRGTTVPPYQSVR